MPTSLTRVVVSVASLDRGLAFYRDLLGLPARLQPGGAMLTAANGVEVLLHERASNASDTSVAATFTVRDLDGVCTAWRDQDGVVVDPPAVQPWGERMAVVRDADGHVMCLVEDAGE